MTKQISCLYCGQKFTNVNGSADISFSCPNCGQLHHTKIDGFNKTIIEDFAPETMSKSLKEKREHILRDSLF